MVETAILIGHLAGDGYGLLYPLEEALKSIAMKRYFIEWLIGMELFNTSLRRLSRSLYAPFGCRWLARPCRLSADLRSAGISQLLSPSADHDRTIAGCCKMKGAHVRVQ